MHEYKYVQQFPGVRKLTGIAERPFELTAPKQTYGTGTFLPNSAILLSVRQAIFRSVGKNKQEFIKTEGIAGRDVRWCTGSYCSTEGFVSEYDDNV